jgi:ubiquitin carboxyl-terminal hydrolase 10
MHQGRRQEHQYYHHMPPTAHSPVLHNPYAPYPHPQHYGHAYPYAQHMQQMQPMPPQWNPYHQPMYAMPPRQFQPQPHASPVVVSSHPHMPPVNRAMGQTPPIVHSHTPPVQRLQTPQPAPSTPSVHSQGQLSASTPPTASTMNTPPPVAESKPPPAAPPTSVQSTTVFPFYPDLPWLSAPGPFPPRAARRRRRRRAPVAAEEQGVALPLRAQAAEEDKSKDEEAADGELTPTEEPAVSQASTIAVPSDTEVDTPSTSHPPSEVDLAHVATPSAAPPPAQAAVPGSKHTRTATLPAVPLIPIRPTKQSSAASTTQRSPPPNHQGPAKTEGAARTTTEATTAEETLKASPPKPAAPKSWAELLRAKDVPVAVQTPVTPNGAAPVVNGPAAPRGNSLADVLASFSVESEKKVTFLEPRGLVNTGNLCYMNSVCQ